jgi:ribosome biogenesis GTPase
VIQAVDLDVGLVVAGHGRHYIVESPEGTRIICHPRGKKSDCVVGDRVRWQRSGDEGVIEHVEPRRNLLFRQDEWKTKSFAPTSTSCWSWSPPSRCSANRSSRGALIAAESAEIPVASLLNKADLPRSRGARTPRPVSPHGHRGARSRAEGGLRKRAARSRRCSRTVRRSSSARAAPARAR